MHRITKLPLVAGLIISGIGLTASPAQAAPRLTVHPGESIQAALDRAPGDATVVVAPGVYPESLTIIKPVTLQAQGRVTLRPPAIAPVNGCTLDPDADGAMPGICVIGQLTDPTEEESPIVRPVTDVHISGFSIGGFTNPALEIYGAQRVSVSGTAARHNPGGGVFVGRSAGVLVNRVTAADNGARGIDLQQGVTDLTVVHSEISGNRSEGVFVADSAHGLIVHNRISGNCSGILLLDEGAGISHLGISHNAVTENNRYCPGDDEGQPSMSGNGIVLAGATATTVSHNLITGNVGSPDPLTGQSAQFSLGGLVLLDAGPLTGGSAPAGDVVTHNLIVGNRPFDVLSDGIGTRNQFSGNLCGTSTMPGICGGG